MDIEETRPRRPGEEVFGLLLLVLAIGLFWQSYEIAGFSALSSPGAFPLAASGTMVIAAVIVVVGNLRARGRETDRTPILPLNVAVFVGLLILYALAIEPWASCPPHSPSSSRARSSSTAAAGSLRPRSRSGRWS